MEAVAELLRSREMKHLSAQFLPIATPPASVRRRPAARGFTLLELMVTISIGAILTTLAAPAMIRIIKGNRVQTEAASLLNDMQFARTEAVKRGSPVSICPSSDGQTCLGTSNWQSGWLVFNDDNSSGTVDAATDKPLRYRKAFTGTDTLTPSPSTNSVLFNREGFTSNLGTSTVAFAVRTADGDATVTRCISVNIGGRLTTQTAGQGSCS
jgi:type IV fimbrial biogenesis protein FimT